MTKPPPTYLTTVEVAALIRTSRDYICRQCVSGQLVAKKVGNEWRIHVDEVERFMRSPGPIIPARRRGRRRAA